MCGINGVFAYGANVGEIDREELTRVRDYMRTRGPDAAGAWFSDDGRVGLGHRRLSIIDLSEAANQPMADSTGRLRIIYNGEIYNYKELRADLEAQGCQFRTHSDTEVLLQLYLLDGPNMLKRLRGMYGLAIWDEHLRRLMLARDPLGIKPLYVADDGSTIRFASQVKALLESRKVNTSADPAGHVGFFVLGHVPEPFTLYKGIRQLPAGSCTLIDHSGPGEPLVIVKPKEWFTASDAHDPSLLREVLTDTVAHHFVSDVPVSLFLSAGRDSATLMALASETQAESVRAVTLAFDEYRGTHDDESTLAGAIAAQYGADHCIYGVSRNEFQEDLGALLHAMDQPTVDGPNTYFVCKVASQLGVRVALSGLGADEIFGGYPSFTQVPKLVRSMRWSAGMPWFGRGVRRFARRIAPGSVSPKYAGVVEYGGTVEGAYLLRRSVFMPWEVESILDRDFARDGLRELAIIDRMREHTAGLPNNHVKIVMLELFWYMQYRLLRDSDWASMAHSLELRVPFVDSELLRRLGPWIASDNPPTKNDMALTPARALPADVLSRPKTGFQIPVSQWLEAGPSQREHSSRAWARMVYGSLAGKNCLASRGAA